MNLPPELVAAALVGASRAEMPAARSFPAALGEIYAALDGRPPEERLLLLAGAAALHATAGWLPSHAPGTEWRLPAFRPEGDRPVCSPAAAGLLERMLARQDTTLFPELLSLLDRAGLRAPDALLPHILDRGAKAPRLRPALVPIIGERGRWLASLNPAWRYAAVDVADPLSCRAAWEADPAGRVALAIIVRRENPAAARRLIETTWRSEPDAIRRELPATLEAGLSLDDEPFLERALDDRDALTRRKAADLLANIPGSRLVGRVTAAAGDILILSDGRLLPAPQAPITDAMVRDGITRAAGSAAAPGNQPRSAADWSRLITQTVGMIPLDHWTERFGMAPEGVIAAALAGTWPRTIITALATAARRQNDRRWAIALLTGDNYSERTGMLLPLLTPDECHALLAERLAAGDDAGVVMILRRWTEEWDEASGVALVDFFGRQATIDPDAKLSATLRFLLRQFARQCPPAVAGYAAGNLSRLPANKAWQTSLTVFIDALKARMALHEAVTG